ncbi:MAG TPA: hypothetical protein VEK39_09880 [Solirubrobacterales bacterium]|nr:hypothetical protein [Solirubrobacterales bacterium]
MANMDTTQRVQIERIDLDYPGATRLLGVRSARGLAVYTAVTVPLLGVLGWAAFTGIEQWYQWIVLGAFVFTTIGVMIAISPARRG